MRNLPPIPKIRIFEIVWVRKVTTDKSVQKFRNTLNGIVYYKKKHQTKFVDSVKYVQVYRSLFDQPVWVRADILEPVNS